MYIPNSLFSHTTCALRPVTRTALTEAARRADLELPVDMATAALGLHVMVDGLIQNWLLDPEAFDLVAAGGQTMDAYLKGLGFDVAGPG